MTELSDEQRHQLPHRPDGNKYQIMVVDDSEFMVNNLKRIIISFNADVCITAEDGQIAVDNYKAAESKPDLITMDITMPNKNGIEAIKEIMAENKAQKIVVVSALGQKEMVQSAIIAGAKHFVVKPFKRNDVYKVFRALLGIK
ncbi:MAG: response regulator [Candidatus Lindowbacteria bacterium]|nr:response regulator [Candidatus Lindowbacteria bacterium]